MNTKAYEVMTLPVYRARENDCAGEVIDKLLKYRIDGMPVVNEHDGIVAYISSGDLMRYVGTRGICMRT